MCTYYFRCLPKTGYPGGVPHFFFVREQVLRALPRNAVSLPRPGSPWDLGIRIAKRPLVPSYVCVLDYGGPPHSQTRLQSECAPHDAGRSRVLGPSPGDPLSEQSTVASHHPYPLAKRALLSVSDGAAHHNHGGPGGIARAAPACGWKMRALMPGTVLPVLGHPAAVVARLIVAIGTAIVATPLLTPPTSMPLWRGPMKTQGGSISILACLHTTL